MPKNAAAAATTSQPTVSKCAFDVPCLSLFDTDTYNKVDSLMPANSSDVVSTVINNNNSQTTTAAMPKAAMILLKTAKAVTISANKQLMARNVLIYGFGRQVSERSYPLIDIRLVIPTGMKNVCSYY